MTSRNCSNCGQPFELKSSNGQKLCSQPCRVKAKSIRQKRQWLERHQPTEQELKVIAEYGVTIHIARRFITTGKFPAPIEDIKSRWMRGDSMSIIARQFGVTRYVIAGRLNRANLFGTRAHSRPVQFLPNHHNKGTTRPRRERKNERPGEIERRNRQNAAIERLKLAFVAGKEMMTHVAFPELDMRRQCRWPFGEPRAMRYCGDQRMTGDDNISCYCTLHFLTGTNTGVRHAQAFACANV